MNLPHLKSLLPGVPAEKHAFRILSCSRGNCSCVQRRLKKHLREQISTNTIIIAKGMIKLTAFYWCRRSTSCSCLSWVGTNHGRFKACFSNRFHYRDVFQILVNNSLMEEKNETPKAPFEYPEPTSLSLSRDSGVLLLLVQELYWGIELYAKSGQKLLLEVNALGICKA